ncbi:MAG TPA: hypothetical protein VFS00_00875 [Polyangiaceae bacterium]|nr:hypothetical protein [Polyangiaceae bacterium]
MTTMQQHPHEWPSPPPASASAGRYLLLGGAVVVMVLGSLGGFYASSSSSGPSPGGAPHRSVPLVPVPIERGATPGDSAAARHPTQLTPLGPTTPLPGGPAVGSTPPAEPVAPPPAADLAPPGGAAAPGASGEALPGGASPVASGEAPPGEPARPVAGAAGAATPAASGPAHKVHPVLAHDPLPDGEGALLESEAALRQRLEGRMASGQASAEELTMLKAICQHQGDAACKEKAIAARRKLSP